MDNKATVFFAFNDIKMLKVLAKEHKEHCHENCAVSLTRIRAIAHDIGNKVQANMTNAQKVEFIQLMDFNDWPY
jgi:hypothetical protein